MGVKWVTGRGGGGKEGVELAGPAHAKVLWHISVTIQELKCQQAGFPDLGNFKFVDR